MFLDPPKIKLDEILHSERHEFICNVLCANPSNFYKFAWNMSIDNTSSFNESNMINSTSQIEIAKSYNNLTITCCVSNFILDSVCETIHLYNNTFSTSNNIYMPY